MNIKLDDGKGGVERFLEVTQKLNTEIDDTGTRAQTATTLFGEEGVRQVGMITATVGDLQTAIDGVGDMRVISPEDVEAARSIKADLTEARDIWQGFRRGAGPVGANLLNSTLRGLLGTTYEDDKARQDRIAQGDFTYRITGGLFGNSGQLPPPLPGLTPAEVQRSIGNLRPGGPITEDMLNRVTIINPPGTPATVVSGTRVYDQRNGVR